MTAVSGGYDADTVTAMTGALAGALHGERAFPSPWLDELECAEDLRSLGDRLLDLAVPSPSGGLGTTRDDRPAALTKDTATTLGRPLPRPTGAIESWSACLVVRSGTRWGRRPSSRACTRFAGATGSLVGNLMGAALGLAAVPADWLSGLDARPVVERIACDLAAALAMDSDDDNWDPNLYPPW